MLSGWKTAGHLACPHCAHDHDAYNLKHGGKTTWFDNHRKFLPRNHPFRKNKNWFTKGKVVSEFPPPIRTGEDVLQEIESLGLMKITELGSEEHNARIIKTYNCGWKKRSIFWDLPYWRTLSIRHNLDVMHIEKNVFENLFNTIMAIEGKTKDNAKARADIALICRRPELAINESTQKYPKACYSLDKKGKEAVCKWLQDLKFPDGYVSNMGRCIDMKKYKLFGMKSHDCHVFMQRLLPIAFREFLPNNVWEAVTELSLFFRDLASSTLKVSDMCRLEEQIPVILCKLERIFPPALFDSMEHLLVHLPYEARIAGPVQYRWMSARRLRLTSSPNPGNSTEHTPIRSQRSQTEHTPAQSRVLSSASANEPEHASESEDPYWEVGSMHDDGRMRVEVISGLLEPSGRCSRAITDSISERQDPDGFSWKAVSKEVKDFYFDEFKKTCVWRQDDRIIHKAWAKKASVRYTNFCSDARARWEKGGQDSRVAMHVWLRWVEFWKTPNFQVKSNTQKKNRKGGADKYPPTHTGGSASLRTHAAVLAKTQGKDPTPADVYLITHTVKHDKKTFVTKKAEQVYKRVETLREELSAPIEGSDEPQVVDEDQLFLKAAGGLDKKSRVYGMGSLQSVIYGPETGGSRHRGSNFRHEEYKQMQVELQDMKNQVKELQEMRNQELEEMRKQMEEMKNQLALVFNHQN
ncbi:hypothetical protein DCAR_0103508 [Daucus carota subsp. sativus]|uniref:DUF4218 domain-containing protein n=2 Tax=Daucus carota subsp. sativus TaxID=79200 RepID=A0AAF0WAA5_DAUCS|nr:hypothetical protein DCAR_0103508 [Daucus carota subsp. sativus]